MSDWLVPLSDVRFGDDEVEAVAEVYRSGWLSQGPRVLAFETAFAAYVGARHAIATANCTAALHLSLVAAGIGAQDEVLLPSLTFAATAAAIVQAGAAPVFADIAGLRRPWLSAAAVQEMTGPRTRAVIAVAYGGHPGDTAALRELCDARGLVLIEDAAHGPGSRLGDTHVGTLGSVGAFSFFANKNLPLGEGGMLVTDDDAIAARARLLRSHGLTADTWARHRGEQSDYQVIEPGFNYRLDEPRAALGLQLLGRLTADNERRAELARDYAAALDPVAGITPVLDDLGDGVHSAWHLYPVLLDEGADRAQFRRRLRAAGVQTSVHYPPLHLMPAFGGLNGAPLSLTEAYARRTVTLPLFAHMTADQQARVVQAVADALA